MQGEGREKEAGGERIVFLAQGIEKEIFMA